MDTQTQNPTHNPSNNVTQSLEVTGVPFASLDRKLEASGKKLGDFYPYDSALASTYPEPEGTRLVKAMYKADKDGNKVADNSYCLVPDHITEDLVVERAVELAPYVVSMLQEWEDRGIKAMHRDGAVRIYTEYLTLDKVIAALEEAEQGARLNAERIGKWFVEELQDMLVVQFAQKLGVAEGADPTEEQAAKLVAVIAAYKGKFESLAGGKTVIKEQDCIAMIRCIELAEAGSTMLGRKFIVRLQNMSQKEEDLLLAL